ncbi:MAG: S24 family peptidase [Candidatus Sulfotelmatobacter sp.]
MSGFSRLWRCPAAKSVPRTFFVHTVGRIRSLQPSMPYMLEVCEDPKLGLAAEMLRGCGTVRLELRGTSMLPSLWPGDLLTIQCAARDEIVPGDIVLVMRDNRFFVHRLIEKQQVQDCILWITKGDAVPHDDPPVAASELLGRVTGVRRGNRSFVPSRRVSLMHSAMAWMLCRWDHFRSVALRIHAARLQAGPAQPGHLFRGIFGAMRGIPGVSPSRTSCP